jgi:septum formation inhibitor MinC
LGQGQEQEQQQQQQQQQKQSLLKEHQKKKRARATRACTLRSSKANKHLAHPEVPLFFVIHSLDCKTMINHKTGTLDVLTELVNRPGVHLIASVDHLNAPLLFSARQLETLSLIWHDVTTLEPYMAELIAHSNEKHVQSYLPAGEGLKYLLECVTKRHLELLQFMANRQLEEEEKEAQRRAETAAANKRRRKEEAAAVARGGGGGGGAAGSAAAVSAAAAAAAAAATTEGGITFEDLAKQCAAKMISRSHGNLRQLFDELLDHRLLKSKGMGTQTRFWIPRSAAELRMIVNYKAAK